MAPAEFMKRVIPRFTKPPEWGIRPVAAESRVLGFMDYAVLWGDLGIGLLVMLAGTFLVPGLGLGSAFLVIIVGSATGSLLLGLVGIIGGDTAVPTMVLLRPVLGVRGSYAPTILNVAQLVGWTIFELIVMGVAGDSICRLLVGTSSTVLWTAVFAVIVILMGVGGPVGVVRQWLEKFAVWVALATGIWLTIHFLASYDVAALVRKSGDGSLSFGGGVDLVVALPISWLPLVADYNRFAKKSSRAFWGTAAGFFITNAWFLSLGAVALLGANVKQEPKEFATAIALTAGWIALLILLADETHNAWADLYSSAVSLQNAFPKVKQNRLIVGLGAACLVVAVLIDMTRYQNFLYVIGSLFIPLFGVLVADYFVVRRRRYVTEELYLRKGRYWYTGGVSISGVAVWVVGVAAYHVANPATLGALIPAWQATVPPMLTLLGGSLPAFVIAFVLHVVIGLLTRRNA